MIGASVELVRHHLAEHDRTCTGEFEHAEQKVTCPCGSCAVLLCGRCHGPVLLGMDRDRPVCEHAEALIPQDLVE